MKQLKTGWRFKEGEYRIRSYKITEANCKLLTQIRNSGLPIHIFINTAIKKQAKLILGEEDGE